MTDKKKKDDAEVGDDPESKTRRDKVGDGIKQGIGVLSAFRDALEETIQEARDRGDLSTERAKEVMKGALDKAQSAAEGARGRLDFATHADVDSLKGALDSIRDRVSSLEESVFGASKNAGGADKEADKDADKDVEEKADKEAEKDA